MPRLSRRFLFAGVAALPAMVVVRPLASSRMVPLYDELHVVTFPTNLKRARLARLRSSWLRVRHGIGEHGPEAIWPSKLDVTDFVRAIDSAVPDAITDDAAGSDDRAFGWEG